MCYTQYTYIYFLKQITNAFSIINTDIDLCTHLFNAEKTKYKNF